MSTIITLVLPEQERSNKKIIDRYYDYLASKEREYVSDSTDKELDANHLRKRRYDNFEEHGEAYFFETLYTDMSRKVDLNTRDIFGPITQSNRIIYGEDIARFIDVLQEAKEQLKQQDDDVNWELTLELQHIALCEFALENGYGIELS